MPHLFCLIDCLYATKVGGVSDIKPASIFGNGKPRDETAYQKKEAAAAATAAIQNALAIATAKAQSGVEPTKA